MQQYCNALLVGNSNVTMLCIGYFIVTLQYCVIHGKLPINVALCWEQLNYNIIRDWITRAVGCPGHCGQALARDCTGPGAGAVTSSGPQAIDQSQTHGRFGGWGALVTPAACQCLGNNLKDWGEHSNPAWASQDAVGVNKQRICLDSVVPAVPMSAWCRSPATSRVVASSTQALHKGIRLLIVNNWSC